MTIEEEFFKCFGIEKLPLDCDKCGAMRFELGQCADTDCKRVYPPITSDILLELIVIITKYTNWFKEMENIEDLKQEILKELIGLNVFENFETIKHQVQSLFKE